LFEKMFACADLNPFAGKFAKCACLGFEIVQDTALSNTVEWFVKRLTQSSAKM